MANALAFATPELVLGRYRPLRPLGSGGSGSVWLVRDEQSGLDVALKIVPREGKAAARAEREAAAAARLRHPSCLRAYRFSRDSQHVYIVYEYVPGRTFREALRAGDLTDAAALEAGAQICEGLAHAHAAGILHRDVKPSNVLLAEAEGVSVRLLDFGLARIQEAETLTAQGDVPGTLAYISPERLAGEQASEASDVWAVGVMLWEALVGRHPFWSSSMLETARAIEDGAPSLGSLRQDLPKPLLAAIDRALAPDPRRRPSAVELAHALRGVVPRRRSARGRPAPAAAAASRARAHVQELPLAARAPAAVLAAGFAGWSAAALSFFPAHWWLPLALVAAAATVVRERAGLAVALAVPVLPLGNVSLGLALVYVLLAVGWFAVSWREPLAGLLPALGPLLGPLAALGLLPLATWRVRSPLRRGAAVAGATVLAALAAGLRHAPLPFTGHAAPLGLGVAGANGIADVAGSLGRALAAQPALATESLTLALAAALLPVARRHGRWGATAVAAVLLVGSVLLVPGAHALPLVLAAWAVWTVVALAPGAET
jgi:eukaryotic-like serine/threonine-protein kinase